VVPVAPETCDREIDGACIGPTSTNLCSGGAPSVPAACGDVIVVDDLADLPDTAANAPAGSCLTLPAGASSASVSLPLGVSLFGCGMAHTTLGPIEIRGGSGAVVHGLRTTGVVIASASDVKLQHIRVQDGEQGITLDAGSSVTIQRSDAVRLSGDGIFAADASRVVVEDSAFDLTDGAGVWVQCGTGCDCAEPTKVVLERVSLASNTGYGAAFIGADAVLRNVVAEDTVVASPTEGGGAIAATGCSRLDADGIAIARMSRFGVLLHGATGVLGGEKGIIVVDGKIGIWLQDTTQAEVRNFEIRGSSGVGLGIGGESRGIIVVDGKIFDTASASVPGYDAGGVAVGSVTVSDGVVWHHGAEATVERLEIGDTSGYPLRIIDPVPAGSLSEITFSGTDAGKTITHQNVVSGEPGPSTDASVPSIETMAEAEPFAQPPTTPAPAGP